MGVVGEIVAYAQFLCLESVSRGKLLKKKNVIKKKKIQKTSPQNEALGEEHAALSEDGRAAERGAVVVQGGVGGGQAAFARGFGGAGAGGAGPRCGGRRAGPGARSASPRWQRGAGRRVPIVAGNNAIVLSARQRRSGRCLRRHACPWTRRRF